MWLRFMARMATRPSKFPTSRARLAPLRPTSCAPWGGACPSSTSNAPALTRGRNKTPGPCLRDSTSLTPTSHAVLYCESHKEFIKGPQILPAKRPTFLRRNERPDTRLLHAVRLIQIFIVRWDHAEDFFRSA